MTTIDKELLKQELVASLSGDTQVNKIVIFGSFITSSVPNDMDVAVFCDSAESYLPLALSLRKRVRQLSRKIPIDLLPIRGQFDAKSPFMLVIAKGEVVYEKGY